MASSKAQARRRVQAAKVAARSAHLSGALRCYVERVIHADGRPDLILREKSTKRRVRITSRNPMFAHLPPMNNLLRDCFGHGAGLIDRWNRNEYVLIQAPISAQNTEEVRVRLDGRFSVTVTISATDVASPPTSVWCYIEEYTDDDGTLGLRLRQKATGRKIEMYGKNARHLTMFLASPQFTDAADVMPNLYEQHGYTDYVLVSGGTAVDSYDVLMFEDDAELTYLLGPTPDTAYRDAFRSSDAEIASEVHARTSKTHFSRGRYREAIVYARLAVETACGGRSKNVMPRLADAPPVVLTAAESLYAIRHVAVHEGDTRVEQPDAARAIRAMETILAHVAPQPH